MKFGGVWLIFGVFSAVLAQHVLVDDAPMCGHHNRSTYQALWDTLTNAGCTVDFTTNVGRYPDLSSYDFVILMHHGNCDSAGFTESQKEQLMNFVCSGGQILIMPMDNLEPLNDFLSDPRWDTGIRLSRGSVGGRTTCIANFPPLTDGIDYLDWSVGLGGADILANSPAYPFVWDESCERVWAAVSYPREREGVECNTCESGGRIIVIAENHTYEYAVVGYVEPMSYKFIVNILTSLAGVGDSLNPCQPPAGIPRLDSIPCVSPGETAHLYGENIPPDVNLYFDGVSIPFTWVDSTEISFTVPSDAVQGYHIVTVETGGHSFRIRFRVYCDWLNLTLFQPSCADIGDTVWFYGENFSPSAVVTFGGIALSDFQIESDTSGWFVVQDTSGVEGYPSGGGAYRYRFCVENSPTQQMCLWVYVPCPCPPDSEIVARVENVRFWERTDGSDTVYIVYDLIADSPQNVVLWCSSDGGITWAVPCTSVSGAVGDGVSPGDSLVIVWVAGVDVPDDEHSNWVFRIELADLGGAGGYGGETPFSDTLHPPAIFSSGDTMWCTARITGEASGDWSGASIASAGDVNGDGYDDIIIGAPYSSATGTAVGRVYVFFGGPGFSGSFDASSADVVITGEAENDYFGISVSSAGDVNGDGYDDVIVGAFRNEAGGSEAGRAYVFFGGLGFSGSFNASSADVIITGGDGYGLGNSVSSAGDVNGDGYDDIIVAASETDEVYVFFGGVGFVGSIGVSYADVMIAGAGSFGVSVSSAGDVNGDGYGDVIVGASMPFYTDPGAAYVFLGGPGFSGALSASSADVIMSGEANWDRFGNSVSSAGDVNGDGYDDVVVGAYYNDAGGTDAGRAYVFFGGTGFVGSVSASSADVIITGEAEYDYLGYSVAGAGDVNGDGYGDIIVGAYSSDVGGIGAGRVYVFFGNSSLRGSFLASSADVYLSGEREGDEFGYCVASAGDFNGDGRDDFMVGTPYNDAGGYSAGRTYLYAFGVSCPYGAVYASGESEPGPIDTWCPRITAVCPSDGEVGEHTTINWTAEDSFIPPNAFSPAFPVEIYFSSDGGETWDFLGTSNNTGNFEWIYPAIITDSAYIMVCATDSFGHTCCDTCGPFAVAGDTTSPWGYAYADTCSPDSVIFVLHDNVGIDWTTLCIQDPLGVLCYPDSMRLVGDTMVVFYPRLPDSIMEPFRDFYVRLWSARDSSGNEISEVIVDSLLTVRFHHPCVDTTDPWGYVYADTCSPDSVIFVLHDDSEIDWSSVCIQDPLGVLCYPDSMRLVGDFTLIFYPRLPDSLMDPFEEFYVRLVSAQDTAGNEIPDDIIDSLLTVRFHHPCCAPVVVWWVCPSNEWNGGTSCAGQSVTFGIFDTTGQEIDTARVYIRRVVNGIEQILPPDSLIYFRAGDTLWITVPGGYSDMDSVWIILDSVFTEIGCPTRF